MMTTFERWFWFSIPIVVLFLSMIIPMVTGP